jgi:hypothetical protein
MRERSKGFYIVGVFLIMTLFVGAISNGPGYNLIQDQGSNLTRRLKLNFTGAGVTCVDNAGALSTDCDIPGGAGSGYDTIQDEGMSLAQETILNFTGAGVTCTPGMGKTDCDIPGGGGGSSPNIATIIRPVPGDFVWINQGAATLSTTGGGLNITGAATGGTNVRAQVANAPAAPWSCTMNFSAMLKTGNARAGLVVNESATGKLESWGAGGGNPAVLIIDAWSSPTAFAGTRFSIGTTVPMFSNGAWFRAAFDGTDMIWSLSPDGVNYSVYFQEAANIHFTVGPDQCGIFFDSEGTGGQPPLSVTLLSFTF